jgi:undecaprenyl-diphosphatase
LGVIVLTIFDAIFQGIVQGLTEFLPVSSSGHLSLIQYFTGRGAEDGIFFTVFLHLGTLLAVVLAFWKTIAKLLKECVHMAADLFKGRFSYKKAKPQRKMVILLLISLLPMFIAFLFKDFYESLAVNDNIMEEGFFFLITSALLFISGRYANGRKNAANMSARDALIIGAMQAVAPLPGISRSGSTIATGMIRGLDKKFTVQFSFMMAIPVVLGANFLQFGDAVREGLTVPVHILLAGFIFSLIFGLLAIRMIRWLVVSDKLKYFAWYTLVLGLLVILLALIESASNGMIRRTIIG